MSNGEHNELRCTGYTRPVNVLKIKSDMRAKYSKMSVKKLMRMITPDGKLYCPGSLHIHVTSTRTFQERVLIP